VMSVMLLTGCSAKDRVRSDDQTTPVKLRDHRAGHWQTAPDNHFENAVPLDLIATDFIITLRQLQDFLPQRTTVDVPKTDQRDSFTIAIVSAMKAVGYGVRWIDESSSRTLFQYRLDESAQPGSARQQTYELAIGHVEMRRSYLSDNRQRVLPASPMYIRGTDVTGMQSDDSLFHATGFPPDSIAYSVRRCQTVAPEKPNLQRLTHRCFIRGFPLIQGPIFVHPPLNQRWTVQLFRRAHSTRARMVL